jgi:hypothetical protein
MCMSKFVIHAQLKTDKVPFRELDVEDALTGEEEFIMGYEHDDVLYTVYRHLEADDEEDARRKSRNGELFADVPYTVERYLKVQNLDEGL